MKKILIIQTAFIGDVVLATPVVERLHSVFPDAKIDFLLRKGTEGLFDKHPFLNNILIWERKENKYRNLLRIWKKIRQTRYDLVVTMQRFGSSGFITAFSNSSRTIGFDKSPFSMFFSKRVKHIIGKKDYYLHEIERNLSLVSEYGELTKVMPRLYPSPNDFKKFEIFPAHSFICIAPASVWYTKQFPKEKWLEFMVKINDSQKIFFIGSSKDKILCDEIMIESGKKNCINFAGELSLLETAALMKNARMNFVNDSGPLHIASAMNADVTAVFCSTVPAFGFGPLSLNSHIIETEKLLDCRPCGLHGFKRCPENHFECAFSINTDNLIDKIRY